MTFTADTEFCLGLLDKMTAQIFFSVIFFLLSYLSTICLKNIEVRSPISLMLLHTNVTVNYQKQQLLCKITLADCLHVSLSKYN